MTAGRVRSVLRWFHIAGGMFVGAYFYSPLSGTAWALPFIKFALIPLLVVSGVAMWKQGPLTRLLRGKAGGAGGS